MKNFMFRTFVLTLVFMLVSTLTGLTNIPFVNAAGLPVFSANVSNQAPAVKGRVLVRLFNKQDAKDYTLSRKAALSGPISAWDQAINQYKAKFEIIESHDTAALGAKLASSGDQSGVFVVKIDEKADVYQAARDFSKLTDVVEYASPDWVIKTNLSVNSAVPGANRPVIQGTGKNSYAIEKVNVANGVWNLTQGQGVVVAVLDSGVDYNHPDIADRIKYNIREVPNNNIDDDNNGFVDDVKGFDFTSCDELDDFGLCAGATRLGGDNDPMDDHGHGTHVAGIIAADGNNDFGVIGVAPQAEILPIKIIEKTGHGSFSDMLKGFRYAIDQHVQIVNCSFSIDFPIAYHDPTFHAFLEEAVQKGIVVVVAAGNDYPKSITNSIPQNEKDVITVAATDENDNVASFSNWGDITVAAPGVNILSLNTLFKKRIGTDAVSPDLSKNYVMMSGTSMAAPFVAGAAALLKSYNHSLSATQIKQIIKSSADDIGAKGYDERAGYGRINIAKAISLNPQYVSLVNLASTYDHDVVDPLKLPKLDIFGSIQAKESFYQLYLRKGYSADNTNWEPITTESKGNVPYQLLKSLDLTTLSPDAYTIKFVSTQKDEKQNDVLSEDKLFFIVKDPSYLRLTTKKNQGIISNNQTPQLGDDVVAWIDVTANIIENQGIYFKKSIGYVDFKSTNKSPHYIEDNADEIGNYFISGRTIFWSIANDSIQRILTFDVDHPENGITTLPFTIPNANAFAVNGDLVAMLSNSTPQGSITIYDWKKKIIVDQGSINLDRIIDRVLFNNNHLIIFAKTDVVNVGTIGEFYTASIGELSKGLKLLYHSDLTIENPYFSNEGQLVYFTSISKEGISKPENVKLNLLDISNPNSAPVVIFTGATKPIWRSQPTIFKNDIYWTVFPTKDDVNQLLGLTVYKCHFDAQQGSCPVEIYRRSMGSNLNAMADDKRVVWQNDVDGLNDVYVSDVENHAPYLTITGETRVSVGKIVQLFVRGFDADKDDTVKVELIDRPAGVYADFRNGWGIRGFLTTYFKAADAGKTFRFVFAVTDSHGSRTLQPVDIKVEASPDLAVNSLVVNPCEGSVAKNATIKLSIKNKGSGPLLDTAIGNVLITNNRGYRKEFTFQLPAIMAPSEVFNWETSNWTPNLKGDYTIKVSTEVLKWAPDSDKSNNVLSVPFHVKGTFDATIRGRLVDTKGRPVTSGWVFIKGNQITSVKADGSFNFIRLKPGVYTIGVYQNASYMSQVVVISDAEETVDIIYAPNRLTVLMRQRPVSGQCVNVDCSVGGNACYNTSNVIKINPANPGAGSDRS